MEHPVKEARHVVRALTQGTPDEQQDAVYRYFAPGASFSHPFCRVPSFERLKLPGIGEFDSRALILAILKWYKILSPKIDLDIESCVFDQRTNLLYIKISQVFSIWFIPFHHAPVTLVTVLHLSPQALPSPPTTNGTPTPAGTESTMAEFIHTPEQAFDAAQEKREHIQKGSEPSYAKVVATGEPEPEPSSPDQDSKEKGKSASKKKGHSRTTSSRGSTTTTTTKDKESSLDSQQQQEPGARPVRYYIEKQEDLYQVNEFLKFVLLAPGASAAGALQLASTLMCLAGVILLSPLMRAIGIPARREGKERIA